MASLGDEVETESGRAGTNRGRTVPRRIESLPEKMDPTRDPFNIRAFSHGIDLAFRSKVTFFVGENRSANPHS